MIEVEIGSAEEALQRLRSFPARLSTRLDAVMQTLGIELRARAQANLEGGVLHRRSGRLSGGVTLETGAADGAGAMVTLGIGREVPYAAYQEYGWHGIETVRAHLRTIREAFGRPVTSRAIAVRSYRRLVNYPAHSFLRTALAEIAPDAFGRIEDAVSAEAEA